MRAVKFVICVGLVFFVSLFFGSPMAQSAEKENHCFTCHTNARKLIQITREIAEANKGKPGASTEHKGGG